MWDRAAQIAELCLRRTCALLPLVTGAVWIPRSHPAEISGEAGRLRVPAVFGYVPPLAGESGTGWHGEIPPDAEPFRLPGWAEQAWPVLAGDRDLATTLNAVCRPGCTHQKNVAQKRFRKAPCVGVLTAAGRASFRPPGRLTSADSECVGAWGGSAAAEDHRDSDHDDGGEKPGQHRGSLQAAVAVRRLCPARA